MGDGRSADCFVHADGRLGVEALDRALADRSVNKPGYRTEEVRKKLATALDDPQQFELAPNTVDPREVWRNRPSMRRCRRKSAWCLEADNKTTSASCWRTSSGLGCLPNLHFACIGQGMTTAMGAVIAMKTPAFLMEGDGGFMMHLAEFETAARYKLPLMVAVMNDQGLAAEYHYFQDKEVDLTMARMQTPDLGNVGVALGGRGALCQSIDDLTTAAAKFAKDPTPTLLDVRTSQNVASIPNRRRFYGQDV